MNLRRWTLAAGFIAIACNPTADPGPSNAPEPSMPSTQTPTSPVVWPDEDYRYQRPEPRTPAALQVPQIERFQLESGIDVYLAPRPTLPTVSMWLSLPTGGAADPAGKRGLASVCMSLIGQGTKSLSKVPFEERQADLAANISSGATAESINVGMSTLRRALEPTLDLWAETLREPGFREEDLNRLRARRITALAQNKAAPDPLARRLWRSVVMGPTHPYGRITTEAGYRSISIDDCKKFHRTLGPQNARLFVAGAITEAEIRAHVEPRLAGWSGSTPELPPMPEPSPREGTIFLAHVDDAAQSKIYIGHPGPDRTAPDYEANRMMAAILGGSFSGRVNMNIREDKGFAYGARARFTYFKQGGWFAATTSVRTDATRASLDELGKEIRRMRTSPVTAEELEREQQAILLSLPANFSTARRMLGTYSSLAFFGLPMDYYDGFVKRVRSVSANSIQRAAAKNLRASDYKVLVVGDAAQIRDELRALAASGTFGPHKTLVELDANGG